MAIVAKYIGGKRINTAFRDSYYCRIMASVVQYNSGSVYTVMSSYIGEDLNVAREMEEEHSRKILNNRKQSQSRKRKKKFVFQDNEKDYGDNHAEPDVPEDVFKVLADNHFEKLNDDKIMREEIEEKTRGQSDKELWHEKRRKLLTASKFGEICHARDTTSCASKVMNILYPPELDLPQFKYGLEMEAVAIKQLEKKLKIKVEPSGLLIDCEKPYLAASLDGKIDDDGIVEIKAPSSVQNLTPMEAIRQNAQIKRIFTKNCRGMNPKHNYYYQVQGQLHISKRKYCYFVLYTKKGIKYVKEEYNEQFWKSIEPKLTRFYMECMLPEIVDSRIRRNMDIKEPDYILEARKRVKERNSCNSDKKRKSTIIKHESQKRGKTKIDITIPKDDSDQSHEANAVESHIIAETNTVANQKTWRNNLKQKLNFVRKLKKMYRKKVLMYTKYRRLKSPVNMMNLCKNERDYSLKKMVRLNVNNEAPIVRQTYPKQLSFLSCKKDVDFVKVTHNEAKMDPKVIVSIKKELDTRIISINSIRSNILLKSSWLNDESLDAFIRIVKMHGNLEIQSVLYIAYPCAVEPVKTKRAAAIVNANNNHWHTVFYDGITVRVFDSLGDERSKILDDREINYINRRFKIIQSQNIIFENVKSIQPDSSSCGLYAAAFLTYLALSGNPSEVQFSKDTLKMRQHFMKIIEDKRLFNFPLIGPTKIC